MSFLVQDLVGSAKNCWHNPKSTVTSTIGALGGTTKTAGAVAKKATTLAICTLGSSVSGTAKKLFSAPPALAHNGPPELEKLETPQQCITAFNKINSLYCSKLEKLRGLLPPLTPMDEKAFNTGKGDLLKKFQFILAVRKQAHDIVDAFSIHKLKPQNKSNDEKAALLNEYNTSKQDFESNLKALLTYDGQLSAIFRCLSVDFGVSEKELTLHSQTKPAKSSPLFNFLFKQHPTISLAATTCGACYFSSSALEAANRASLHHFNTTILPNSTSAAVNSLALLLFNTTILANSSNSTDSLSYLPSLATILQFGIPISAISCALLFDKIKELPADAYNVTAESFKNFIPTYLSNSLLIGGVLAGNAYWNQQPYGNILALHAALGLGHFAYSNISHVTSTIHPLLKNIAVNVKNGVDTYFREGWKTGIIPSIGAGIAARSPLMGFEVYGAHLLVSGFIKLADS